MRDVVLNLTTLVLVIWSLVGMAHQMSYTIPHPSTNEQHHKAN